MGLPRHDGDGGRRFVMREKLLSIGDDFSIEDDGGQKAFKVDGKALRVRRRSCSRTPQVPRSPTFRIGSSAEQAPADGPCWGKPTRQTGKAPTASFWQAPRSGGL